MATMRGNQAAGTASGGRCDDGRRGGRTALRAKLAAGVAALGCAAALALGGLPAGGVAGADSRATALPAMLAVDDRGCVHASAEGLPGEGCGPARYTLIPVGAAGDEWGCVYASHEGVPGEGCGPVRDDGDPRP
jgi:hypothetical protein